MAWEERSGRCYYYRKRREGGRVLSEYVGGGLAGEMAAMLEQMERERRAAEREPWRRQIAAEAALDQEVGEYDELVRRLTAAALLASGYYRAKRQWRIARAKHEEG